MLHPSYSELMEAVNSRAEEGEQAVVQSRYSIVKATAERAKQIIDARYLEEKYDKITIPDKDGKDRAPKKTPEDRRKIFMGYLLQLRNYTKERLRLLIILQQTKIN